MSQESSNPSAPAAPEQGTTPAEPGQETTPRKKSGCCLKGILIMGGLLLLLIILVIWQVLSVKSWIEDGMESSPAALPQPELTEEEQKGIEDIYTSYPKHYEKGTDVDVLLTPAQFNSLVAENIAKEKAKGRKVDLDALQVSFDGPATVLRGTALVPEREGLYYNFEVRGEFAIENAKATCNVEQVRLRGVDAPFSAKTVMREALRKGLTEQEKRFNEGRDSIFARLKLLKREGDKIHVILNGEHLERPGY